MLRRDLISRAARPTKHDGNLELAARHVKHFCGGIGYWSGGQDQEVEGDKVDNWPQPCHRCTNAEPRKSKFRNRRIDNAFRPKVFEESPRDFVSPLIFRDF